MNKNCCPICTSNKIEYFSNQYTKKLGEKSYAGDEKLYQCSECASIYRLPIIDNNFLEDGNRYYDQMRNSKEDLSGMIFHIDFRQKPKYDYIKTNILDKKFSKYHKWLDVGSCGYATTFDGYDVTTIEPDINMVELGKELFQENKIICSDLFNYQTDEKFDAILFNHSFYCVGDPDSSIKKIDQLLNKDGIVLIGIGHIFMDAYFTADAKILSIEDILLGETMKIYYSQESLEYLMYRYSYELIDNFILEHDIPSKGAQTRYLVFQKCTEKKMETKEYLKDKSMSKISYILDKYEKDFSDIAKETFKYFNSNNTLLIGNEELFYEINSRFDLSNIIGFIPFGVNISGITINNVKILDNAFINDANVENILILDIEDVKTISMYLEKYLENKKEIYCFSRTSSINHLYVKIKNRNFIANSFMYKLLNQKPKI